MLFQGREISLTLLLCFGFCSMSYSGSSSCETGMIFNGKIAATWDQINLISGIFIITKISKSSYMDCSQILTGPALKVSKKNSVAISKCCQMSNLEFWHWFILTQDFFFEIRTLTQYFEVPVDPWLPPDSAICERRWGWAQCCNLLQGLSQLGLTNKP